MEAIISVEELTKQFIDLLEHNKYQDLITLFERQADYLEENDYYAFFYQYLDALLALKQHKKVLMLIDNEFIMPGISEEDKLKLNEYYDLALRNKQNQENMLSTNQIKDLLVNESDLTKLSNLIMSLENINIRNILEEASVFLNRDVDETLKTMLLEKMIQQQITNPLSITKNNKEYEFVAIANQLVMENHNYLRTRLLLNDHLAQYPSYLMMAEDILNLYAYIIYPEVINEAEVKKIAALIEYYVFELNEVELINDFELFYNIDTNGIIKELDMLTNIINGESK